MVNLREKPFYLNDEQIKWVEETYASMTTLEKVQQLFFHMAVSRKEEDIKNLVEGFKQGGLRWQGGDAKANWMQNMTYQKYSKIPLLIAANCDDGGNGAASDGTFVATAAAAAAFTAASNFPQSVISGFCPVQFSTAARIWGAVAPQRNSFLTWVQISGPSTS